MEVLLSVEQVDFNTWNFRSKNISLVSNKLLTGLFSLILFDPLPSHQQNPSAVCVESEKKRLGETPS